MTVSAVIMMIVSMLVIWGVAGWMFVLTLRQEEAREQLTSQCGGFEPFSPRAFHDLEQVLADSSITQGMRRELQACHEEQIQALQNHERHLYEWPDSMTASSH